MRLIPGYSNYSVTKSGRVWSHIGKGGWLKSGKNRGGYMHVILSDGRKRHTSRIHRLVLLAFVGPCPNGMECRHLNGDKTDNRLENLCWGTHGENHQDSIQHGTHLSLQKGEKHPNSKLSDQDRRLIFSVYHDGVYTQRELATHFGVCHKIIHNIVHNNRWGGYERKK